MKSNKVCKLLITGPMLLIVLACNVLSARLIPTPKPPIPTSTPIPISQQVILVPTSFEETNQTPPFTIKSQTPQLMGSYDPRVTAFNQLFNDFVTTEVDIWRQSFLQDTTPTVSSGSFLEVTYTLLSQIGDIWSFKFDFHFYSNGAAHPGLNVTTVTYDLGQGRELALADLFLPNSDYLGAISNYCIAELSQQPGFDGPWAEGAKPTMENYGNWNITSDGLLITFEMYQVAPGASGPQQVSVPYTELRGFINPEGPLGQFAQ